MRKVNKKRRARRIFFLCFLVFLLIVGGTFGFYSYSLRPTGDGSKKVAFEIKENASFDQVVDELKADDLIHSKTMSKLYAKMNKQNSYYAGKFELDNGMSTKDILAYIGNPKNSKKEQVTLTVPEGKWAKEVAEALAKKFPYKASEIEKKWNDMAYIKKLSKDYTFLDPSVLNNSDYKIKLEGYLFPDTYSFNGDASIDEITRTFLNRFQKVYDEHKTEIKKSGYSLQEILSLASVVQFESSTNADMKKIAGVFYNRLNEGMKLGSSVTVCYALYDEYEDPTDCEVKTDVDSPYNTYLHSGLPIGPILNPGEQAIKAVLHPTKTDDLYFLADINGDGKVYYSKTLEEHEAKMKELGLVLDGSAE